MNTVTIERAKLEQWLNAIDMFAGEDRQKALHEAGKEMLQALAICEQALAAQRQWVGLTDEDAHLLANEHLHYQTEGYEVSGIYDLARAIETNLRSKNNG